MYKLYIQISALETELEKKFVAELLEDKRIITLLKTEGAFDYALTIAVKTVKELARFMTRAKSTYKKLLKEISVTIVVYSKVFKLHKLLLDKITEPEKIEKYAGEETQIKIDDKDIKILSALSQHANQTLIELAKATKLSLDVVKYRLRALTAILVTSYRAIPNFDKLGYYHYAIMLKLNATEQDEEKLTTWCLFKKNVLYCTKRISQFDFEVHIAIKDINEFNQFVTLLRKEFSTIIESYETLLQAKLLKLNYVPF